MPRKMSKKEVETAQWLKIVYDGSCRVGDEIDPKRQRKTSTIRHVDTIARLASEAFVYLTGKSPNEVSIVELNTIRPAPWTKEVEDFTEKL